MNRLAMLMISLVNAQEDANQCRESLSECQAEARWSGEIDYSTDYWQDKFERIAVLNRRLSFLERRIAGLYPTRILITYQEPQPVYEPRCNEPCPF